LHHPGIGSSIATDLNQIGIFETADLKNQSPDDLYLCSSEAVGIQQDCCLLYVFRCAAYSALPKVAGTLKNSNGETGKINDESNSKTLAVQSDHP